MIDYIIGEIVCFKVDYFVVECNNIGYAIYTSNNTMKKIGSVGSKVKVYTYMHVREDAMLLYGFSDESELEMFKLLQTVSKIGPKVALGILSSLEYLELNRALAFGDHDLLSKAPGIGKKTAQRMVLELKDKINIDGVEMSESEQEILTDIRINESIEQEALEALMSLGYSKGEVQTIISKNNDKCGTTEEIIKIVLKEIGR